MSDASIKALGLREYRGACAYSAAYTANWMLESLKLGKHNLSIVTLGDTCDSCANARIPVHVGTTKVCGICGKHFGGAIELKKIVRREITSDTVKLMPGDCGSRACLLKKKHPDWTLLDCSTIADRKVQIGMSEEQVIASWGRPRDINRTVTAAGVSAQWVYHDFGPYLYFDDGVLTSIQD